MTSAVETSFGRLSGCTDGGVLCFRGVPYAAPPLGPLRFRAPQPPGSWAGVRPAQTFGAAALQLENPVSQVTAISEDCLYLNVWTPARTGKRPVLVFVHGGAFVYGAGHEPTYHGAALAERGDVVVVTLNYRLSALGFAYLVELVPQTETAANSGLLDVLAALRWVRSEIAAFGGDAQNVTVFGESAGGAAVAALLGMPSARGLFARAICQSGSLRVMPVATANAIAHELLALLGVDPASPERLWTLPGAEIIRATRQLTTPGRWGVRSANSFTVRPAFRFGPVGDGSLVPADLVGSVRAGANPVPLITGTNRHEWRFFSQLTLDSVWGDAASTRAQLSAAYGEHTQHLIDVYGRLPELLGDQLADVADAITGDAWFRMPSIALAQAQAVHSPVFMYLLDHRCQRQRGALGACHVIDLPLVFRTLASPAGQYFTGGGHASRALSDVMSDAWLAFARGGDPRSAALPSWPRYDTTTRATQLLAATLEVLADPFGEQRVAWDSFGQFGEAARARTPD